MTATPDGVGPGADEPPEDDPVEAYLDAALVGLQGSPREVRRMLAEIESHLLDAAAEARAEGAGERESREIAVRRLGPVSVVNGPPSLRRLLPPPRRRRVLLGGLQIGGVGFVAAGLAGAIGLAVQRLWGDRAIATPFPPGSYTASDCARWQANYPRADGCVAAMTADHAGDFLRSAAACALLGLAALALRGLLGRRWSGPTLAAALPAGSEEVAGAVLALAAAVLFAGGAIDAELTMRGAGAGQPFSLSLAALLAAALFAARARRTVHSRGRGPR